MIRQAVGQRVEADPYFRWRGGDVSRIEALSDACFAIALALLVVAMQLPRTYAELMATIASLPGFALCFLFLMWCWWYHYKFFRRYGLEDIGTVVLNGLLLLLVLFYVYPLRFIIRLVIDPLFGGYGRNKVPIGDPKLVERADGTTEVVQPVFDIMRRGEGYGAMIFYAAGFAAIWIVFALMNWNAYRRREALELDEAECYLTRADIRVQLINAGVAFVALALAIAGGRVTAWSGLVFVSLGPLQALHGYLSGKRFHERFPTATRAP